MQTVTASMSGSSSDLVHGEDEKYYSFTNGVRTRYSVLDAGALADKPNYGFILGITSETKTGNTDQVYYEFPGTGAITFTSVQGDIAYFKTANGGQGSLNAATDEIIGVKADEITTQE